MAYREIEGEQYLTTGEVAEYPGLKWSRDALYRLKRGKLIYPKRFFGDRRTYWKLSELMGVKNKAFSPNELPKVDRVAA